MSTWKPVAVVLLLTIYMAVMLKLGMNHYTDSPNDLGWAMFAGLVIGGLWFSRYV